MGLPKKYKVEEVSNPRERAVRDRYVSDGWVVLKRGWPDLFCYNPLTKEFRFVEVKSKNQLKVKVRKNGRLKKKLGLSQDQLRMHQYLDKIGIKVILEHVE